VRSSKGKEEPKTAKLQKKVPAAKSEPAPTYDPPNVPFRKEPKIKSSAADKKAIEKGRERAARQEAERKKQVAGPKGKRHAFDHSEEEPSLAERARKDLAHGHERHDAFHGGYHKDEKGVKAVRHLRGRSANQNFHGTMHGGASFVSKPHEAAADDHEPEHWGKRHEAAYSIAAAMGAHHMVLPGFESKFHDHDQMDKSDKDIVHPDEHDLAHEGDFDQEGNMVGPPKKMRMARYHAGKATHVVQHEPNHVTVGDATDAQLEGVDHEHRVHGLVMHLLQSNSDGHEDNVMIHGEGHPILIDHDLSFASEHTKGTRQEKGKTGLRSVFQPGGKLDYTANAPKGEDGKPLPIEFPERMQKTLQWLAMGGHSEKGKHHMGLSDDDAKELQTNARELMTHGIDGVLERRHLNEKNV
jgi:hypothetical protein